MSESPTNQPPLETAPVDPSPDATDAPEPRAIIAGAVAALIGGGLWALVVIVTKYELGWIAWGVGALVGVVMARATPVRGPSIAAAGAVIAAVGLVAGKAVIAAYTINAQAISREITADSSLMLQAASWHLASEVGWPEGIQARLDSLDMDDTLPDALWADMRSASAAHAASWTPGESVSVASAYARAVLGEVGALDRLRLQFGPWDLLWFGLAIVTAFRMLRGGSPAPETQTERT